MSEWTLHCGLGVGDVDWWKLKEVRIESSGCWLRGGFLWSLLLDGASLNQNEVVCEGHRGKKRKVGVRWSAQFPRTPKFV